MISIETQRELVDARSPLSAAIHDAGGDRYPVGAKVGVRCPKCWRRELERGSEMVSMNETLRLQMHVQCECGWFGDMPFLQPRDVARPTSSHSG